MIQLFKRLKFFQIKSQRATRDNDFFSDRLFHRHTTKFIVIAIILSTFKRFFSGPIHCWIPAELKRYQKYMQNYCWLKGTFYVSQSYDLNLLTIEARDEQLLRYYQWVIFFLCIQAFLFYLPRLLWYLLSFYALDYDLFNMVDAAMRYEIYSNDNKKILDYLTANLVHNYDTSPMSAKRARNLEMLEKIHAQVDKSTSLKKDHDPSYMLGPNLDRLVRQINNLNPLRLMLFRLRQRLLTISYVICKLSYLAIALLQLHLMDRFLSNDVNKFYGGQVVQTILNGEADIVSHNDSRIFPRITVCDVKTRELGDEHIYTVQCVLTHNLLNERIYAFLWFWICVVLLPFVCIDLVKWFVRLVVSGSAYRVRFVKNRLQIYDQNLDTKSLSTRMSLKIFTEYYLGADAIFVLRLLERNSNANVVSRIIERTWKDFQLEFNV